MIISYTEMMLSSTNTSDYYCFLLLRSPIEHKEEQTWSFASSGGTICLRTSEIATQGRGEAIFAYSQAARAIPGNTDLAMFYFLSFKVRAPFPQTLVTI